MIDDYIILNRRPSFIIKLFGFNIVIILIIVIIWVNASYYQTFFHIHSYTFTLNSKTYLEVFIPAKEVNLITKSNKLVIDNKEYSYYISYIENKITYYNEENCQKMYLEVNNLDSIYKLDGYQMEIKILGERKKIREYF